jgi:hypothetical protein
MITHTCRNCTSKEQEVRRLQKRNSELERQVAYLMGIPSVGAKERECETLCASCGHQHPRKITRHHRVPQRLAWKIPYAVRESVLIDGPEIVMLCEPCHRFIEMASSCNKPPGVTPYPCRSPINAEKATVTWARLMDEIREFERIAATIEENEQAVTLSQEEQLSSHFAEILKLAIGPTKQ